MPDPLVAEFAQAVGRHASALENRGPERGAGGLLWSLYLSIAERHRTPGGRVNMLVGPPPELEGEAVLHEVTRYLSEKRQERIAAEVLAALDGDRGDELARELLDYMGQ